MILLNKDLVLILSSEFIILHVKPGFICPFYIIVN